MGECGKLGKGVWCSGMLDLERPSEDVICPIEATYGSPKIVTGRFCWSTGHADSIDGLVRGERFNRSWRCVAGAHKVYREGLHCLSWWSAAEINLSALCALARSRATAECMPRDGDDGLTARPSLISLAMASLQMIRLLGP